MSNLQTFRAISDSAHDAASRILAENATISLSGEESRTFAEALLTPQEPSARLQQAAQRYLRLIATQPA